MRELDDLLLRYLDKHYDDAPSAEKVAFEALLTLPDPDLVGYLLKKQQPEDEGTATLVQHILCEDSGR